MDSNEGETRRNFLQGTLAAAAGVGMLQTVTWAAEPAKKRSKSPTSAKWPIACRDVHLREVVKGDPWAAMKAIGVDGIEVELKSDGTCSAISSPKETWSIATEDGVKRLRDRLAKEKVRITAFCVHNRFDERPDAEVEEMTKFVKAASILRVPAIRIDIWPHKLADKPDEFLKFAIDMGKRLVKVAEGTEVRYGVENHGTTTNRPEFLRKLFDGVGSPRLGLTLDTANLYWYGHPLSKLYEIFEEFAPRVYHTHCKSIRYPEDQREKQRPMGWEYGKYCCPVYEGDIDFNRVAAILRKAGYRGDLCVEDESLGRFPEEKRGEILKREVEMLRKTAATM